MPPVDQNSVLEAAMSILFRGGWVLAPIFVLGWFGWFLMLERYAYYFMLRGGSVNSVDGGFWKNLEKRGEDFAFEKLLAYENEDCTRKFHLRYRFRSGRIDNTPYGGD